MSIVIKQRVAHNNPKGFEEIGFAIFPDCSSEVQIPFVNNKYVLGFDGETEKQQYFEGLLGVKFDTPEGLEFLDNYRITFNHEINILGSSPKNEFDIHLIKANKGFGLIKMTDEDEGPVDNTIFQIFDEKKEMDSKITKKAIIYEAISEIQKLWDGNRIKLVLVAKYLFEINAGVTSEQIAYDKLTDYVQVDKTIRSAENAQRVLKALKVDSDYMDAVVDTKTAMAKNIIRLVDGWYVNHATQTKLGRNLEDTVIFLNNPNNQDEFGTGGVSDSPHTIKTQLKNSLR